jgi:acyl dehydratase
MRYVEDFPQGHRYTTGSYTLTEAEIVEFAKKYDPQYFHLDADAARNSHFGGLVSAGVQTIALCWKLAHETGLFDDVVLAGIGFDHVRWLKPVRVDDVVHVELFLVEMKPSTSRPDRAFARFQYEMKNQRGEVVLTLQMLQIVRRRPNTKL